MTMPESVSLHYFELISSTHASVSSSTFLRSSRPLTNCTIVMTRKMTFRSGNALRLCCSDSNHSAPLTSTTTIATGGPAPPVLKRRKRYRREYPGESKGITEELRFVAMRLHNVNGKKLSGDAVDSSSEDEVGEEDDGNLALSDDENDENGDGTQTWQPSLEGFLKYLVDSKLVFSTVERIVDESGDVACKFLLPDCLYFVYAKTRGYMIMLGTNTGVCDRRDLTVGTILILPTYGKSEP
ncbi:putative inactive heme oxygenase 2 [Cucumis melo var. makuwa]|uniref:Inactive heme oxygenase 2 n=1 Tax=Cucumis melo var. makuwa TaxID=1194695 RepID=A0A5A7VBG4_CUCMM|nr:putative inactive heme oxygenase 2 [Cucumis melo var. makuwa]